MTSSSPPVAGGPASAGAFPDGFLWGAATSAYQIEGGVDVDGRGRSVWDEFCGRPGAIVDGSDGTIAVDHRHRFREDVALMEWLGLGAYRFSVAWPRVQPGGRGPVNQPGLDFYDRLVDELLARRIEPMVTLFHWDLPVELQAEGGWANRDVVERFAEYAALVYRRLGDRIRYWVTINEPRTYAFVGHAEGIHAPGAQSYREACAVAHHLLLGHGRAVEAMRSLDAGSHRPDGRRWFGLAPDPAPVVPMGDRPEDIDVARRIDGLVNRFFLDPVLRGRYPDDLREDLAPYLDGVVREGDETVIAAPVDFLGVNYYRPYLVEAGEPASPPSLWPGAEHVRFVGDGLPQTDNGWYIDAGSLETLLVTIARDYPSVPLFITENGAAYDDVLRDGAVEDRRRIDYLDAHIRAVRRAMAAGVDVRGYFVWSLLDNFEWERGYTQRFGIVHVDLETLARVPKASAHWYRELVGSNRLVEL